MKKLLIWLVIVVFLFILIGIAVLSDLFRESNEKNQVSLSTALANEWWLAEYPALIQAVESADNRTLFTNYRTGPEGEAEVKVTLVHKANDGLILKMNLPSQAIYRIDPKTGEKTSSTVNPVITIRDHNLDGMPDDFYLPGGIYKEELTDDEFIKFKNEPDYQVILVQWSIGIGFAVNHFLHGIDSVLPRN